MRYSGFIAIALLLAFSSAGCSSHNDELAKAKAEAEKAKAELAKAKAAATRDASTIKSKTPDRSSDVPEANPHNLFLLEPKVIGLEVEINGACDSNAGVKRIMWNWGDGKPESNFFFPARHRYEKPGTYQVRVTTHDDSGKTSTRTTAATVSGGPTSSLGGDTASRAATGTGVIADPASNLTGDTTRTFMDILETTIKIDGDSLVLEVLTAAPFPSPSEMAGGKRFDFIWFVDIDKNQSTGQSDRGNDYNIHLFLAESGWHTSWYKVSPISENDGVAIDPGELKVHIEGARASLAFPKSYLPSKSFEMWATCFSGNAPNWPPRTENPPTQRDVFAF